MASEDKRTRLSSLKWQLRFRHERRKMVEQHPELTPDERADQLAYHDRLVMRLQGQLIEMEGHRSRSLSHGDD